MFEFDEQSALNSLKVLKFIKADIQWLDFVKDNRLKLDTGAFHDIVIGPVANDDVLPTIQAYIGGQFSAEAALVSLRAKRLFNQYCFLTEAALALLFYKDSYFVGGVL